jgi:large subunit ribosomal protein L10
MPLSREKKQEVISELETIFKDSEGVVFVGFKGLKVNTANIMRREFKGKGVGYLVAKKTLISRALSTAKVEGAAPEFTSEVAVAYSKENLGSSREVWSFLKKNKNALTIQGGIFEGKFISAAEVTAYASIPDQKTLYSMFVNVINSPIKGLAVALDAIAGKKQA